MSGEQAARGARDIGDVLSVGFGTAVAMWALGFLTHLPLGVAAEGDAPAWATPPALVFALLVVVMVLGGRWIGRRSPRGVRGGAWAGGVTGLVNLLILGSVLNSLDEQNLVRYALVWAPVLIVISAALGALGAALGVRSARQLGDPRDAAEPNWRLAFAMVALAATLLLIAIGGSVTGFEAGLAVPDWPSTFGYNMFLFPLAKMTGGIYFEHAHRLLGTLVGLTTLVLAGYLVWVERRGWVKALAIGALVLVVVQGLLGAVRVTGPDYPVSRDPADLAPSAATGMVHGALAHLFFITLIVLACALSGAWRDAGQSLARPTARRDRTLGAVTLTLVFVQIVLGVILRQSGATITWALHLHLTLAAIVIVMVMVYGLRAWGLHETAPLVGRFGKMSIHTLLGQIILGFGALWAILVEDPDAPPHPLQVVVTTLHQTFGALLLGLLTAAFVWSRRLVAPTEPTAAG